MSFLYNAGISPTTYICTIQLKNKFCIMETMREKAAQMLRESEVVRSDLSK